MKMNKLFVAALAAMTLLASCSKEDNSVAAGEDGKAAAMQIKLTYGDAATYSLDNKVTGTASELRTAMLYEMVGTNAFLSRVLTSAEVSAMTSAAGLHIENVSTTIDGVMIVGNIPAADVSAMQALIAKADIEAFAIAIASQQPAAGSAGVGVAGVTIMGYGAAVTTTPNPAGDGHEYKLASVTVAPVVARMEVSGQVVNSPANENQLQSITWKKVWFNRYYTAMDMTTMQEYMATAPEWTSGYPGWATDAYTATTETGTKCYAYHFFPATGQDADKLPMIVMQADLVYKDGRTSTNQYITIKRFESSAGIAMTQMMPNKIYKVNLSNLTVDHTDFTPQPNPAQIDLGIKVTITPWTEETITPII